MLTDDFDPGYDDFDPGYDDEVLDSPGPRGVHRSPSDLAGMGIVLDVDTWFQCRSADDYRRYDNHLRRQRAFAGTAGAWQRLLLAPVAKEARPC